MHAIRSLDFVSRVCMPSQGRPYSGSVPLSVDVKCLGADGNWQQTESGTAEMLIGTRYTENGKW